jgi:hypothetical protein
MADAYVLLGNDPRKMSPEFIESVMGFPPGWTSPP